MSRELKDLALPALFDNQDLLVEVEVQAKKEALKTVIKEGTLQMSLKCKEFILLV